MMVTPLSELNVWVTSLPAVTQDLVVGIVGGLIASSLISTIRSIVVVISTANILKSQTGFSWFSKTWICEWEPESPGKPAWTKEDLIVRRFFNKLFIRNCKNDQEYCYKGTAVLARGERLDGKYLLGSWFDLKEGATAAGVFMLTIEARGNFLFGYIVGPNDQGPIRYGKYVVGRTPEAIAAAKQMFTDRNVPMLPPSSTPPAGPNSTKPAERLNHQAREAPPSQQGNLF
jgi:hypothetical protein